MTVAGKIILEPTTQAFVDSLAAQKGKPIYELSYKDARKVLEDAQAKQVSKSEETSKTRCCQSALRERYPFAYSVRQTREASCRRSCTSMAAVGCWAARILMTDC